MTNTTKQYNFNQTNMIKLAFMLEDDEIKKMIDKHFYWVLDKSEFNPYMKEYVRNVFDRFVKESKPLLECINRKEVIKRCERLWKLNEKLTSVNIKIRKEVIEKLDEHGLEEMEKLTKELSDKIEEFDKEIESVISFYESL